MEYWDNRASWCPAPFYLGNEGSPHEVERSPKSAGRLFPGGVHPGYQDISAQFSCAYRGNHLLLKEAEVKV